MFLSNISGRNKGRTIQNLIFFISLYLYLWFIVQPNLIYHGGGQITNFPIFYTDLSFFKETVLRPGGLTEYLSDFLSQLLILSWLGSLILIAHSFLVCFFTRYILKQIGFPLHNIFSYIPAILLLITYNSYTYHFTATLALLAALVFFAIFIRYESDKKKWSVFLFIFLFILLYLIAAGLSFYFTLLCVFHQIFIKRGYLSGLIECAAALLSGFILTHLVFNLRLDSLYYSKLLPFSTRLTEYPDRRMIWATASTFLLLPVLVSVFGIWRLLFEKRFQAYINGIKSRLNSHKTKNTSKKPLYAADDWRQARWFICINMVFPVFFAFLSILFLSDISQKPLFKLCFYLRDRSWPKVLEMGRRYQNNKYFNHAFNRALYHRGLLLSNMFSFQQNPSSLFFMGRNDLLLMEQQADIFYDLGCVNDSEQLLIELFEAYGPRPEILKKLAVLKLAKNDTNTARVYIGALSKSLFYSDWAKNYLKKIDADAALSTDAEVQRLRSLMPQTDNVSYEYTIEERLTDLLRKNRTNKMAFEYLIANYLFMFDLDNLVMNLPRLDDFNYKQIPRHYEEAILIYEYVAKKVPDLKKRAISTQTQQRFSSFIKMINNPQVNLGELKKNYGDTYEYFNYIQRIVRTK